MIFNTLFLFQDLAVFSRTAVSFSFKIIFGYKFSINAITKKEQIRYTVFLEFSIRKNKVK